MSIVPVKIDSGRFAKPSGPSHAALAPTNLKGLGLREDSLEELVRDNPQLLFPEEDESLLVVGQQVSNVEHDRADLIGLLPNGKLVVVEVKRDREDMRGRREALEWQAMRYAASVATIRSPEELARKLYAPLLARISKEPDSKVLIPQALETIRTLLADSDSTESFNEHQEIILVASDFDERTLAACSWLVKNGIPLRCVRVRPHAFEGNNVLLEVATILPPPELEDWFVEIGERGERKTTTLGEGRVGPKVYVQELFDEGLIKPGDKIRVGRHMDKIGTFIDPDTVELDGARMSPTQYGLKVTGWSAFSVYGSQVFVNDKRMKDLRASVIESRSRGDDDTGRTSDHPDP